MPLTETAIRSLKPAEKHRFVADGNGLYLRVHPTGTKTFMLRSREGGKARWLTLGEYPSLSLAEARRRAVQTETLPSDVTVEDFYEEWMRLRIAKEYKRPEQVAQRMMAYFIGGYRRRKVHSLTRAEITQLLADLAERAPVAANRLTTDLKLFFGYAEHRGLVTAAPTRDLTRKNVGGKEKSRDRVLSDDELAQLIREIRSDRFAEKTRIAIALLLMTGQRSGEVRGIEEAEVIHNRVWRVPPQRTKNGIACTVALGSVSSTLLNYAFKTYGSKPFEGMEPQVLSRVFARIGFGATPHDLRRTMATRMADMGVAPHVIEKCLNHKMAGVMAIYNRSEYLPEKSAAWRLWWRYLLRVRKKEPPDEAGG